MNTHPFALAIAIVTTITSGLATAQGNTERAGDVLRLLVPAAAYGMTFYWDDPEGRMQFYKAATANALTTQLLKRSIDSRRPNGEEMSFPSGHASVAFQGAAFVHSRYGIDKAWPAYVAATYVAYSRVHADQHHLRDVLAGAALGMASSFYFTHPRPSTQQVFVTPYIHGRQVGLLWSRRLD